MCKALFDEGEFDYDEVTKAAEADWAREVRARCATCRCASSDPWNLAEQVGTSAHGPRVCHNLRADHASLARDPGAGHAGLRR